MSEIGPADGNEAEAFRMLVSGIPNEKLASDPFFREMLHRSLDALLDDRLRLSLDEEGIRDRASYYIVRSSTFLALCIGNEIMRLAFDPVSDEGNSANQALSARLCALFPLIRFGSDPWEETKGLSVWDIVEELYAIEAGEPPSILTANKRKPGQRKSRYRQAILRLAALEWDEVLKEEVNDTEKRHTLIAEAFGTSWETIAHWRRGITKTLGIKEWEERLWTGAEARRKGSWDPISEMKTDGLLYRALLRG